MYLLGAVDAQDGQHVRNVRVSWNPALVAASIAISLLGAFTSTQLMCQARVSRGMTAVVTWTVLASLTFGFCSIWSLHMVAMLAFELDLPVGLNVSMTVISALLAVTFTFLAFSEVIWDRYRYVKTRRQRRLNRQQSSARHTTNLENARRESEESLLDARNSYEDQPHDEPTLRMSVSPDKNSDPLEHGTHLISNSPNHSPELLMNPSIIRQHSEQSARLSFESDRDDNQSLTHFNTPSSRRTSSLSDSENGIEGMGRFVGIRRDAGTGARIGNPFTATAIAIWIGLTPKNICKGFVWSLAITCMHYMGIYSLEIEGGSFRLRPLLVTLSAIISWLVCSLGCILMPSIEMNMGQQLLFSVVASSGVAAMHYSGMAALEIYSASPPSELRGYPLGLPIAIASIAIVTCIAANALLAHSATLARNKLAEIVRTRKKLWAAIAQKENAEAAAMARSEFIASASHEIRTPLHQLQGYSDLMARCPLPDDARLLLFAIQDATKTLSLITNNVLDWSRLEKGEAMTRPTNLDVRSVCDSVVKLLPRRDDDLDVELMAVVSPSVARKIFIDETYLQRIIMNLVSNSLKFTRQGYVSLHLSHQDDDLVIVVKDTGIGIPESFLPHLFEPFKQAQTRGAEHGTGLGLSIVKQLLDKVHGSITVNSLHKDSKDIGPTKCGSQFTVTMPTTAIDPSGETPRQLGKSKMLAYIGPTGRVLDGLTRAWNQFQTTVCPLSNDEDVPATFDYVWVDIIILRSDLALLRRLSEQAEVQVLVIFTDEETLDQVLGHRRPPHFVPIKRPWVFHQIMETISAAANNKRLPDASIRTVRFAPETSILSQQVSEFSPLPTEGGLDVSMPNQVPESISSTSDAVVSPPLLSDTSSVLTSSISTLASLNSTSSSSSAPISPMSQPEKITILLVEDNKVNQKLGQKMLTMLNYSVILASDGQEAVDILLSTSPALASSIDIILMDQSMPRKDGLTATKEIRALEQSGEIAGSSRWKSHPVRRNKRPILAVTAVVGPGHEAMCKMVGTDAFLAKPLSLSRLKEALDTYVEEMEQRDDFAFPEVGE